MRNKRSGAAALIAIAVMVAVVIGLLAAIFASMNSQNSGGDDAIKAMGETLALATAQMDALSKLVIGQSGASGTTQIASTPTNIATTTITDTGTNTETATSTSTSDAIGTATETSVTPDAISPGSIPGSTIRNYQFNGTDGDGKPFTGTVVETQEDPKSGQ